MHFVYLLRSTKYPKQIYIGYTENIRERLKTHNAGQVPHTSKPKPWTMVTYTTFADKERSLQYEKYLKSGSGRQFLYKHFL
ncbi:MAG: GIY-YIG nuclease family protein [Candidatus Aadella gelida]|nr:GIY-YIG nuclease family protein [Candidatus Aadella gelida]